MDSTARLPRPRGVVLAMLLTVYIFNFLDRQILAILAAPIQAELGIEDAQMGLLGGLAFAILYTTLAVPLASIADRTSRSWVITCGLVVWSGFTAACGVATSFWQLFAARVGVGVGEAGGVAPSYAIIGDYFPSRLRAFALGIYSMGIPVGSALGVMLGGYIAATVDWRLAFFVVGFAGIVIAPIFKWVVRDVPRPAAEKTTASASIRSVASILFRKPAFWLMAFGAASGSMLGYGVMFWMPSLLIRSFGLSLVDTSLYMGALTLIGGCMGTLGGGFMADRLGQRNRAWYGRLPAIAYAIAAPFFVLGAFNTTNPALAFLFFLVPNTLAYAWLGPVLAAVQHLVPVNMRATASALFLLINNLIGLGGGIYVMGALSQALAPRFGEQSLQWAMVWGHGIYFLAAALMLAGSAFLVKGWVDEQPQRQSGDLAAT